MARDPSAPEDPAERGNSPGESGHEDHGGAAGDIAADVILRLPPALRDALRDPLGPVTTEIDAVLETAGEPLVTVGDIVTYHVEEAGAVPDVAVIDGRTRREAVDPAIEAAIGGDRRRRRCHNPPGTITHSLLDALVEGLSGDPVVIVVDGEEDLAALPAIAAAPDGASVCYGQPDAGTVHVDVDVDSRSRVRDLIDRMDGDHDRFWRTIDRQR